MRCVNIVRRSRVWRDIDGSHPEVSGHLQIARVVLKHCGGLRGHSCARKDFCKGLSMRLWSITCVLNSVDRFKVLLQATRLQYPACIRLCAVGIDDFKALPNAAMVKNLCHGQIAKMPRAAWRAGPSSPRGSFHGCANTVLGTHPPHQG